MNESFQYNNPNGDLCKSRSAEHLLGANNVFLQKSPHFSNNPSLKFLKE